MLSLFEEEKVNGYDYFPPEEGSIDQYFGRLGSGKTYALTAEILDALCRGQVVLDRGDARPEWRFSRAVHRIEVHR
ncbi:MAG: hypothetical protein H7836_17785, partial [Magnetococcus sp. YQC-3]